MKRKLFALMLTVCLGAALLAGTVLAAPAQTVSPGAEMTRPMGGRAPEPEAICEGGTPSSGDVSLLGSPDYKGAAVALAEGLRDFETTIYLDQYNLPGATVDDARASAKKVMGYVLNRYADIIQTGGSYSFNYGNGVLRYIKPTYSMTPAEYDEAMDYLNGELDAIIAQMPSKFTDFEKVLFIHDYLARNFRYDYEGLDYDAKHEGQGVPEITVYDAYNFFKQRKGVCQAYTETVEALLDKLKIPVSYVQSDNIWHIWNLVQLNGRWYQMDVTWDDPGYTVEGVSLTQDALGCVGHDNFLITDATSRSIHFSRAACDWDFGDAVSCTDTTYENSFFVQRTDSGMDYDPGTDAWYFVCNYLTVTADKYIDTDYRGIYKWTRNLGACALSGTTRVVGMSTDSNSYDYLTALQCYRGYAFYSNRAGIYCLNLNSRAVETLRDDSGKNTWGIRIENGRLYYQLRSTAQCYEYSDFPLFMMRKTGAGTAASPYLIYNEAELGAFRTLANATQPGVCGTLAADIPLKSSWTSIGSTSQPYTGTFKGAGHTVSGLSAPLFRELRGTVELLEVRGNSLCVNNGGTVRNCYLSTTGAAALVENNTGAVANSYSLGSRGLTVQNTGTVTQSYFQGSSGENAKSAAQFTSGEVAWLLNGGNNAQGVWRQDLAEGETTPSLRGSAVVYSARDCAGGYVKTFSNDSAIGVIPPHNYDSNGICTMCGGYEPVGEQGGVYAITKPGQLAWLARESNGASFQNKTVQICNDLDLSAVCGPQKGDWTPMSLIGEFKGTLEGKDGMKTLSGLYISNNTLAYQALVGHLGSAGTVRDLRVTGQVSGLGYSAGLVGENKGRVERCISEVKVTGTTNPGGLVGVNTGTLTDSMALGAVSGTNPGGLAGSSSGQITACFSAAAVGQTNTPLGTRSGGTVSRVYYLAGAQAESASGGEAKTAAQLASGEVTWQLQGDRASLVWGQDLKTQTRPALTSAAASRVWKVAFVTKAQPEYAARYANHGGKVALPDNPADTAEGTFSYWSTDPDGAGDRFNASTAVTADVTVYAVGRTFYGPTGADTALSMTYDLSSPKTFDLSDFAAHAAGTGSGFVYTIKSQTAGLGATVSEWNLVIPAGTSVGNYSITLTVMEKMPMFQPMSVTAPSTQPFDLTLTLQVSPKTMTGNPVVLGSYTYTGSPITPMVSILDGTTIIPSSNYTVTCENNVNAGTATVTLTGKNNYTGTRSTTFAIRPKDITETARIVPEREFYFFTGESFTPAVTVYDGDLVVPAGEYTVSYSDNTQIGTATVTVTDKAGGNYVVGGTGTFKITPPVMLTGMKVDAQKGTFTAQLHCQDTLTERTGVVLLAFYDIHGRMVRLWMENAVILENGTVTLSGSAVPSYDSVRAFVLAENGLRPLAILD